MGLPLLVASFLLASHPYASARRYKFVLEGLRDAQAELRRQVGCGGAGGRCSRGTNSPFCDAACPWRSQAPTARTAMQHACGAAQRRCAFCLPRRRALSCWCFWRAGPTASSRRLGSSRRSRRSRRSPWKLSPPAAHPQQARQQQRRRRQHLQRQQAQKHRAQWQQQQQQQQTRTMRTLASMPRASGRQASDDSIAWLVHILCFTAAVSRRHPCPLCTRGAALAMPCEEPSPLSRLLHPMPMQRAGRRCCNSPREQRCL